jgi:hypothetical protein
MAQRVAVHTVQLIRVLVTLSACCLHFSASLQ